jgi:hypothetical protein
MHVMRFEIVDNCKVHSTAEQAYQVNICLDSKLRMSETFRLSGFRLVFDDAGE